MQEVAENNRMDWDTHSNYNLLQILSFHKLFAQKLS